MNDTAYYTKKKQELLSLIHLLEQRSADRIDGTLRVSSGNGYPKYYRRTIDPAENKLKNEYIEKKDIEIARQLAQQEYEEKLLKTARTLLHKVTGKAVDYDDRPLQEVYTDLHEARKQLVSPLVLDDEAYAEEWMKQNFIPGSFSENAIVLYSEKGERVRSKSEKIIADKYYRRDIPYLYERPLDLWDGNRRIALRPDFTLLNKRTRQEFYHEHFGMIDTPEYADNLLKKLELYAANGIFPGDNLLITMESSKHVLNEQNLELIIKQYLL